MARPRPQHAKRADAADSLDPAATPRSREKSASARGGNADRGIAEISGHAALQFDPLIVLVVGALMTLGVVMVYSASVSVIDAAFELKRWWDSPLKQGAFAALGFLAMLLAAQVDYRVLHNDTVTGRRLTMLIWLIAAGLLLAVFIPGLGTRRMGATRWIRIPLGPVDASFQPGELAKVLLIIWLSAKLSHSAFDMRHWRRGFWPILIGAGALVGVTTKEDYGTGALMGVTLLTYLLLSRASFAQWMTVLALGALLGGYELIDKPHRVQRLLSYASTQPSDSADQYQVHQSLMAIGSGGWWGRGLGAGVQKYGYLPQAHNDFILAIICEELGVAGGLAVVVLYLLLILRAWWIALVTPDRLGKLLATGLALMIGLQAAFNVAVVTHSVPTKGISLPFVSAGGSGVVFLGIAAGLLASVGGHALRTAAARRQCA